MRDREHDVDSLRVTSEEARQVVDHQITTLSDIDDKAMWTLRLIVFLFGLLLTATSLAIRAEVNDLSRFRNVFTNSGVMFLTGSLLFAIVAYTDSRFKAGPSARDIDQLLFYRYGLQSWRVELLKAYRKWINENNSSIRRDALLLTMCQVLLLGGIGSIMYGIVTNL